MSKPQLRIASAIRAPMGSSTVLKAGASLLALSCLATPAFAQDAATTAAADEDNTIVVTGIRASLEAAMDIKRDATGVVDAISAEDIGKFPDTNLAESLQRIPGVSINRVNGEGSQVTVRGFGPQFNLVTVNGRQMATSFVNAAGGDQDVDFSRATSRSFDFNNLASEGVSRLEVYKTGRSAIPTGGIGATINVVTQRPLEVSGEGLRGSIGAKALYDLSNDDFTIDPEVSGVVTWSDEADTFGVSVFGAYQKRQSAAASATSNYWNITRFSAMPGRDGATAITNPPADPNTLVAVPNDSRYHYSEFDRERINASAVAQFRPIDTLTVTADALFAQNEIAEQRSDQTNWFNRPFDSVTFDQNEDVATAIYLEEGTRYGTKDIGFEQQYRATKTELQSYGLNAEWEVADGFTLTLDGNHSVSNSTPNARNGASSTLVSFGAPVVAGHSVDYSGEIPNQQWSFDDSGLGTDGIRGTDDDRGNNNGVLDIGDLGTQVQRTNASYQRHRLDQLRADLSWEIGEGRFSIGGMYIDSQMTSSRIQTQQTLGDWGITRIGDIEDIAGDLVEQYCLSCMFDRYTATDAEIAFRGNAVDLYEALADAYVARGNAINISGNDYDQVSEEIFAAYAQLDWKGELMGRQAGLVAGVRFENTKVNSYARVIPPTRIEWDSDNDFTRVLSFDTPAVEFSTDGEYNNFLPAIDFQIEPMDDVVARVSYSKTIARADYGNLFASQSANAGGRPTALGGVPTGSTGNPGLLPLISDNFDVSLEWYFAPTSYVSAAFFAKKVKNFVGVGQFTQSLFGLRDPSSGAPGSRSGIALDRLEALGATLSDVNLFTYTALLVENGGNTAAADALYAANSTGGSFNQTYVDTVLARTDVIADANDPLYQFSVATPINQEEGNIHGFELQGQYFFGDSGFGVSGSFTKVYGDVNFDVAADPTVNVYALVGLADSFNVTGIYDKGGLSARVAYNWRDKFLSGINRGGNRNPTFFDPFGTLDLSVSYEFTENIAVSLEAVNVLSEPIRSYARSEQQVWFAQEQKPRIFLGARYRF